jgi:anaerobic ribonucleoside-triphosphate reductase activating protein
LKELKIKVAGIVNDSIVDGPGLRLSIFAQGCPHNCEACHNPSTHDPAKGYYVSVGEIIRMVEKNPLLDGVTFTGGEPFSQAAEFAHLAGILKNMGLHIVIYTGHIFENLLETGTYRGLLVNTDILIDGPFIQAKKTLGLPFRGSSNQRLIDVKAYFSGKSNYIIE